MSGRSAYVRAKKGQFAEDKSRTQHQNYTHGENIMYGMSGPPPARLPEPVAASSHTSDTSLAHPRYSISSASSSYNYAFSSTKSRPTIVQSSIEKSDFRHHLDGMSKSVRGKLGRLIKGADDHSTGPRSRALTTHESSESGSRSTEFTPSATVAPSLDTITPLGEPHGSGLTSPQLQPSRTRAQQQGPGLPIHKFEGGGRGLQPGWKKTSNVRYQRHFLGNC